MNNAYEAITKVSYDQKMEAGRDSTIASLFHFVAMTAGSILTTVGGFWEVEPWLYDAA